LESDGHFAIQGRRDFHQRSQFEVARPPGFDASNDRLAHSHHSRELALRDAPPLAQGSEVLLDPESCELRVDAVLVTRREDGRSTSRAPVAAYLQNGQVPVAASLVAAAALVANSAASAAASTKIFFFISISFGR
jgi:hypothetical protein